MLVLTTSTVGCSADEVGSADVAEPEVIATKATPFVGTWRWEGSGGKIGEIALGEEDFVFRDDGTYAVLSKRGDGASECYEGTFTWSSVGRPDQGTIVFKGNHLRDATAGFERDVVLEDDGTLHFGEGGTYRRTGPAADVRCESNGASAR